MRIAILLVALTSLAHADKVTRAVKRAGFANPTVLAKGDGVAVVEVPPGTNLDGMNHRLLVETKRGRVIEIGEPSLGGVGSNQWKVSVSKFYGRSDILDVVVSSSWSSGMGGGSEETHYLVRAKKFVVVCTFAGSSSDSMEDASSASQVVLAKLSDAPLSWTATTTVTATRMGGAGGDGRPTVVTFTLGAKGNCTQR